MGTANQVGRNRGPDKYDINLKKNCPGAKDSHNAKEHINANTDIKIVHLCSSLSFFPTCLVYLNALQELYDICNLLSVKATEW